MSGGGKPGASGMAGMAAAPAGGSPSGLNCPPEGAFVPNCVPGDGGEGGSAGEQAAWCEVDAAQGGQGGDPGLSGGGEGGVAMGTAGDGSVAGFGVGGVGGAGVGGTGFGGTGLTGSGSGGGPGGGSGFGGSKATGGTTGMAGGFNGTLFPIDDLQDGDELTLPILGGRGVWFVSNDATGEQFPAPCVLPTMQGMHTFGRDFDPAPGGWAQVGISMRSGAPACDGSIDASTMDGVRFRAQGSGLVRFMVTTSAVVPPDQGGTCLENCFNSHGVYVNLNPNGAEYFYLFDDLRQEPWGTQANFEASEVRALVWNARSPQNPSDPVECFDFWIDDVAFFKQ